MKEIYCSLFTHEKEENCSKFSLYLNPYQLQLPILVQNIFNSFSLHILVNASKLRTKIEILVTIIGSSTESTTGITIVMLISNDL